MEVSNILRSYSDIHIIDSSISPASFVALDLSLNNKAISDELVADSAAFALYIKRLLTDYNVKALYGGYNEKRRLYKRSTIFSQGGSIDRDIHIGLDIWTAAGTLVLAALDGEVHSFRDNCGTGNYGPTIIMKHKISNHEFYSLYGHLSRESIEGLKTGKIFRKGEAIGTLGDASVNGDYPPHLHFQIIKDIGDYFGDYPGVCTAVESQFYMVNCPDPNLLLKI